MTSSPYELAGFARSKIDKIVVPNVRADGAHHVFDQIRAHAREQGSGPKRCVLLVGPSHAGKSTIIEVYAKRHNTAEALKRRTIPVLWVKPEANLTRKGLAEAILETFECYGFQRPPMTGSETTLLSRVRVHLRAAKVELLVIDDFQHVINADTKKVTYSVSEMIKAMLINGVCPIVMCGVEEARQPLLANAQLANRAEKTIELRPLDAVSNADLRLFMEFMASYLKSISALGVVLNAETLLHRDTIMPIFEASGGLLGVACNLIKSAVSRALNDGRNHLRFEDLALAADDTLFQMGLVNRNPFRRSVARVEATA